ncbi:quinon protein alcohol dehydrogenase-like superfamily [Hygrophoropsis aurantiaca]|uniref:Quinon protein alcohol dehydrogenase-like superfamily n=1 Tax=Hygrophoropsis aurantiaca TaxID=72124 RepID=A0ACB7ZRR0_9AGAM|nr:quinon protein alcohol dehydrogenase-like superfamily [Hygrophoropsis aurantiaca]
MSISTSPEVEKGLALQVTTPTKVFEGHPSGRVTSVAYFSDGKRIISGSADKTVRIWNVENQKQEGDCLMHDFPVRSVALSPDGRTLVSAGKGITLWDLESRTVIWKSEQEAHGYCVAYSPSGKLIAASHGEEIALQDAETGQQFREPLQVDEEVRSLAFSPHGMRLATGSGTRNVRVYDVATGKTIVGPFKAHQAEVTSLVFTLDGQQIITASGDGFIRVWDAATGHEVGNPMPAHIVSQIALNADGRRIASVSRDQTVRIWDLTTRRQIGDPLVHAQRNHLHYFYSVSWSPDGRSILAGDAPTTITAEGDSIVPQQATTSGKCKIHLWDVPVPHDVTVPVLTEDTPPLPSHGTSRSRPSPTSSVLDLPATSLPAPSPLESPKVNTRGEGDNWEYATNESFDSVLDLNADGTQPAQRRKRRRRRGAPTASTSPPSIPVVPNVLPIAQPESNPPQSQILPPSESMTAGAPADTQISTSQFGPLTRFWRKMTATMAGRTHKPPRKNANKPTLSHDNHSEMQQSQGSAGGNPSRSSQINNSRPRQRNARRSDEIGMIAPAPMYDRYQVATEEYWYDPNNPPLIDRIFFCMICCGVPKDDASYITNADSDPGPNVPTPGVQAGPSTSQNHPIPSAANTTTSTDLNATTPISRLGGFSRIWRRILNVFQRPAHRQQHDLQGLGELSQESEGPRVAHE